MNTKGKADIEGITIQTTLKCDQLTTKKLGVRQINSREIVYKTGRGKMSQTRKV
jgi:hypothetical protein